MTDSPVDRASALLAQEASATLCTGHAEFDGWPFGSTVPYAVAPSGDLIVFVSDIAEHTKNLLRDPRASLFIADPAARDQPQAGARVTLMVQARQAEGDDEVRAEGLYFARFPRAEAMRGTHGFRTWILEVERVRWIAGYGEMGWFDRDAWAAVHIE